MNINSTVENIVTSMNTSIEFSIYNFQTDYEFNHRMEEIEEEDFMA